MLLIGFFVELSAQETIYFNDFESGNLKGAEYEGQPVVSDHISFSVWTNNSGNFEQQDGAVGDGISIKGNGTKSIFFKIQIEEGYQLDITGYNFWARKTKAAQGWTFVMNSVEYANGETDPDGSYITGNFTPELLNQTGTIEVEFRVNGMGNGYYILDNFELFGQVSPICDEDFIESQPQDEMVCRGDDAEFSVALFSGENKTYQWQVLLDGNWKDLTNDVIYDNVNSSTLTIVDTTDVLNQNEYRCIVTEDECDKISDQVTLTVIPLPDTDPIQYNN
ncbi:hypothetical protein [Psychroflexus sediminis]|uniref:hypothetical protein n=1 Tax=Psychroflexus sediminis TaxID=470826 RepID=UPI00115FAD2B|nr:hypothetical protein [Psychroflexus sediminis]